MRVVLDTNALMAPVEVGVRTFEELDRLLGEYEALVPEAVLAELDRLAAGAGETASRSITTQPTPTTRFSRSAGRSSTRSRATCRCESGSSKRTFP